MTPFSFEWAWDAGHLIFLGFLYVALIIIAAGLIYSFLKTWAQLPEAEEIHPPEELAYRSRYSRY